jgi:hypothetical protein
VLREWTPAAALALLALAAAASAVWWLEDRRAGA